MKSSEGIEGGLTLWALGPSSASLSLPPPEGLISKAVVDGPSAALMATIQNRLFSKDYRYVSFSFNASFLPFPLMATLQRSH